MSKRQLLCLLGLFTAVFLFLGIDGFWDKIISVVLGLLIIIISYNLPHEKRSGSFTENSNHNSNI
jgi:hypothetical protein